MTNIHDRIGEKIELAGVYFTEGAFRRAAALLRQAAKIAEDHADQFDRQLTRKDQQ